jgi:transposase
LSINAACKRIGPQLGILTDTLRGLCKQADIDDGPAPGVTTAESEELRQLRRENAELLDDADTVDRVTDKMPGVGRLYGGC